MQPIEQRLLQLTDVVTAASEAVSSAGDACFTIVAGQIAGLGADCLDKWFLTEERHSAKGDRSLLNRKKAEKMAAKLSKHVSTPH